MIPSEGDIMSMSLRWIEQCHPYLRLLILWRYDINEWAVIKTWHWPSTATITSRFSDVDKHSGILIYLITYLGSLESFSSVGQFVHLSVTVARQGNQTPVLENSPHSLPFYHIATSTEYRPFLRYSLLLSLTPHYISTSILSSTSLPQHLPFNIKTSHQPSSPCLLLRRSGMPTPSATFVLLLSWALKMVSVCAITGPRFTAPWKLLGTASPRTLSRMYPTLFSPPYP